MNGIHIERTVQRCENSVKICEFELIIFSRGYECHHDMDCLLAGFQRKKWMTHELRC